MLSDPNFAEGSFNPTEYVEDVIVTETGAAVLLLPEDWWVIPLVDPTEREKSIKALVEKRVGKADENANIRKYFRDELSDIAEAAATQGGVVYGISLMLAAGEPVSASCIIYREPTSMEAVRVRLTMQGADAVTAESESGCVFRTTALEAGPEEMGAAELEQLVVEYWLDPQDGNGLLHAVFTTPHLNLQPQLVFLFDAIVASVVQPIPDAADLLADDADLANDDAGLQHGATDPQNLSSPNYERGAE